MHTHAMDWSFVIYNQGLEQIQEMNTCKLSSSFIKMRPSFIKDPPPWVH